MAPLHRSGSGLQVYIDAGSVGGFRGSWRFCGRDDLEVVSEGILNMVYWVLYGDSLHKLGV